MAENDEWLEVLRVEVQKMTVVDGDLVLVRFRPDMAHEAVVRAIKVVQDALKATGRPRAVAFGVPTDFDIERIDNRRAVELLRRLTKC